MRLRLGQRRATFLFPAHYLWGLPAHGPRLQITLLTLDPRPESVAQPQPGIKTALEASVSEVGTTPKGGRTQARLGTGRGNGFPGSPKQQGVRKRQECTKKDEQRGEVERKAAGK